MAPGQARAERDPEPRPPEGRKSMPIRYLPDLALSRDVPQSPTNRVKCLIYNTRVARRDRGATSLGHVRRPAAVPPSAAPPRRRPPPAPAAPPPGPPKGPRRHAPAPARLVDRDDHDRLVRGPA